MPRFMRATAAAARRPLPHSHDRSEWTATPSAARVADEDANDPGAHARRRQRRAPSRRRPSRARSPAARRPPARARAWRAAHRGSRRRAARRRTSRCPRGSTRAGCHRRPGTVRGSPQVRRSATRHAALVQVRSDAGRVAARATSPATAASRPGASVASTCAGIGIAKAASSMRGVLGNPIARARPIAASAMPGRPTRDMPPPTPIRVNARPSASHAKPSRMGRTGVASRRTLQSSSSGNRAAPRAHGLVVTCRTQSISAGESATPSAIHSSQLRPLGPIRSLHCS